MRITPNMHGSKGKDESRCRGRCWSEAKAAPRQRASGNLRSRKKDYDRVNHASGSKPSAQTLTSTSFYEHLHSFCAMGPSTRSRTRVHDTDTLNKRRKVEQEQPEVSQEVVPQVGERHESLWFRDGNVVVAGQGKAFRVHSGILAFHSSVFKTLLSDPALAALPERLEGCPVLWTGDRSETLAQLLQIIYDGGKRCVAALYYLYCSSTSVAVAGSGERETNLRSRNCALSLSSQRSTRSKQSLMRLLAGFLNIIPGAASPHTTTAVSAETLITHSHGDPCTSTVRIASQLCRSLGS